MAGTIRSYTVAGWAISGLAAPSELPEPQVNAWLERYQYFTEPSLTLGTPGTGFSARIYKADIGHEAHEFAAVIGLGAGHELILVKDPGALMDLLCKITPVVQASLDSIKPS